MFQEKQPEREDNAASKPPKKKPVRKGRAAKTKTGDKADDVGKAWPQNRMDETKSKRKANKTELFPFEKL